MSKGKIDNQPLVSICSTTYNLEKYISDAIDSWLKQETNFQTEIIIADDGSSDNTVEIINTYIKKHPDKIKLIATDRVGKMPNFIRSLEAARGRYVAVCDGDDYWIDTKKLQKQVDFLEKNPDFSACFTNSYVINELTGEHKIAKEQVWDEATTLELLDHNDFNPDGIAMSPGHTSTYVYRNFLLEKFPQWMYGDMMTDFPLYMVISKYGNAKFINDVSSVYRHHPQGVSTREYAFVRTNKIRIHVLQCVNEYFDYQYAKKIKPIIAKHYLRLAKFHFRNKDYLKNLSSIVMSIMYDPKALPQKVMTKLRCRK